MIARVLRCRDRLRIAFLVLACLCAPGLAHAATAVFDATRLFEPHDLDCPWLIHAGDDAAYASPSYDDSQWMAFNPHASIEPIFGRQRPEVVWYRLHVKVDPAQKGLGLLEFQISRAFEIYANGRLLMRSGSLRPFVPYTLANRILAEIPPELLRSGEVVVALRVHISKQEWGPTQNPGYYADNLSIGHFGVLRQQMWLTDFGENLVSWADRGISICLGLIALVLFRAQRRQTEYLWIAASGGLDLLHLIEPSIALSHGIPMYWEILSKLTNVISPFVYAGLYLSFVHQRLGWRWRSFLLFTGICNYLANLQGLLFAVPLLFAIYGNLPFIVLLSVVIPVVLAMHWRRGNKEAGLLLIPTVFLSLYIYGEVVLGTMFQFSGSHDFALYWLRAFQQSHLGPIAVSLNNVSNVLASVTLAILILQRSSTMSRRQALFEAELEAAQQVQQVLVPEKIGDLPGFAVESVYLPAQQVGGDFFQIIPVRDSGLLIVVGDVAGKGLPAAMLVSALVGAVRSAAEFTQDPGELLSHLNDRLVGRAGGGFSTAVAVHIGLDGWLSVANAGHIPPYLNGRELDLPGALPLGVAAGTRYALMEFGLEPGSRLTFYSDGVVEAQSKGELFGFERSRELSLQPAAAIAEAARTFGQQDDITVLTIERIEIPVAAA